MPPAEGLRARVRALPRRPGVYLFRDAAGDVLYVGKAKSLRERVSSYVRRDAAGSLRTARLVERIAGLETIVTATEEEALLLEANLVREHAPRFNVRLRDDKTFPYVKVTVDEPYPRVLVTRRLLPDGARYFGPFTDVGAMRKALRFLQRRFTIRTCSWDLPRRAPDRPCLDFHIDRCRAPCVGRQDEASYRAAIDEVLAVLGGHTEDLRRAVEAEMSAAAARLDFELAAELRDVLAGLASFTERRTAVDVRGGDRDVLGLHREGGTACAVLLRVRGGRLLGRDVLFLEYSPESDADIDEAGLVEAAVKGFVLRGEMPPAELLVPAEFPDLPLLRDVLAASRGGAVRILAPRRGQKRRLLELAARNAAHAFRSGVTEPADPASREASRRLALALGLAAPPRDLLCFDISTLGGAETVGSAVWLRDGRPRRSEYRRFRVRAAEPGRPDDPAAMQEVVGRYFQRRVREDALLPDLVLVDGGRGQLGAARQAMEGAGVSDLPVAALAKRHEEVLLPGRDEPVVLERRDPALHWLQRVRDEAHRFAVGYNRTLRRKRTLASALSEVPGVGPARELALLHRFGSPAGVARATEADVAAVEGIGPVLARRILTLLRGMPGTD
ncbi:MAG: excinuclease ABC subunit UvrC [Gemmatimonadota bacterium]|nr:excinuclease ABC subunit UvrC [Gemmatimonadota bacterium]